MRSENVISWNLPNFITVVLMLGIIWAVLGVGSNMLFGKKGMKNVGVKSTSAGNLSQDNMSQSMAA